MKKKDVEIILRSTYESEHETDKMNLNTDGVLESHEGRYRLIYFDTLNGPGAEVKNVIEVNGGGLVSIARTGAINNLLVMEKQRRHNCQYTTEHGSITIGVTAQALDNMMDESGGVLSLAYTLDINSKVLSKNTMEIHVKEKEVVNK